MASQYDSIKTAEELLKEVAAHGLSTKPEDICRAQDIFGRSEVKELIRLANDNGRLNGFDGEPDPRGTYSSGRVGLRSISIRSLLRSGAGRMRLASTISTATSRSLMRWKRTRCFTSRSRS